MKRILSICFVFCLVFTLLLGFSVNAHAAGIEKTIGGSVSKIAYIQSESSEEIRINTANTGILRQFVLAPNGDCANYRLGFEIKDATIDKNGFLDVNKGSVLQIRYAQKNNPKSVSVVVETNKKPVYSLEPSADGKSLVLKINGANSTSPSITKPTTSTPATPKPSATPVPTVNSGSQTNNKLSSNTTGAITKSGAVSWTIQNNVCTVKLDGINLSQPNAAGKSASIELRQKEKILQISIPGQNERFVEGILSGNSVVHGFLVNYNAKLDTTFIRIAWKDAITYSHEVVNGSSLIKINSTGGGSSTSPTPAPTPTPPPATPAPTPAPKPATDSSRGDTNRTANVNVSLGSDTVTISAPVTNGYKIYRVGAPSRIVIEIPGVMTPSDKLMPAGFLYQRATVSQLNTTTGKIVLESSNMPQWNVTEASGKLTIKLTNSGTTNLEGGSNDGQVALRLKGANIVSKYRQLSSKIVTENNTNAGTFAFMLPSDIAALGQGNANMEDTLLKSVQTLTTADSSFLVLNKKDPNKQFKIIESSNSDELLIVVNSNPSNANTGTNTGGTTGSNKLIVLDAGHGGHDPGATVGSYWEKHYNLDITFRVEAILKQRGYNVILSRRTDTFISLEDRALFANNNNAALFISIHNNMMPNPATKGSMTLYYPTSYKGKEYARIILNNLAQIGMGGMGSAGLSARDIVVLRKTKMPAVLIELACMSNQDDLNLLNSNDFIQKASENIANSIVQIVDSMN